MKDFLTLVLPPEGSGLYAAWNGADRRHYFLETIDALAAKLQEIDNAGGAAYYATATFSSARRLISAVQAKRALYFDIDFKDVKDADPVKATIDALKAFCRKRSLPPPTYLTATGGGVHVYWVLDTAVPCDEWLSLANGLKQAAIEDGVPADHPITGDAARILRPPGTHNRKYTPAYLVQGHVVGKPVPTSAFASIRGTPAIAVPEAAKALTMPNQGAYKPFWIRSIVQSGRCPLMKWALTPEAQTRENMTEALWSDLLATASKAEDGAFYAHEFSKHDVERYSAGDVDSKLLSWRGQQHPRTCARFATHGKCGNCPNKTTNESPIKFGYFSPESMGVSSPTSNDDPSDVIYALLRRHLRSLYPGESEQFLASYKPPTQWPSGFGFDPQTFRTFVSKAEPDEDGDLQFTMTPLWGGVFWPQHKLRDEKGVMSYEFVFWPRRDETPARVMVPIDVYGADSKIIALLTKYGFPLAGSNKPAAVRYFCRALDLINEMVDNMPISDAFGWDQREEMFNFGTSYIALEGGKAKVYDSLPSPRLQAYNVKLAANGSLDEWKRAIATYEGPGRERHRFAMVAGFASAYIPFTINRMSHLLHIYSDASGSGKTSLQQAIQSIWGEPIIDRGRATYKAMIDKFSVYGNIPGVVDEITKLDGSTLRDLAFDIAAGEPRARLNMSGERLQHGHIWRLIGVSSANTDIEYEISRTGNAEGEFARITSLEIPAGVLPAENEPVFHLIFSNYGLAGRAFIARSLEIGANNLRDAITVHRTKLIERYRLDDRQRNAQRFRVDVFAAMLVANEVATECALTNFSADELLDVMDGLMSTSLSTLGDPTDNIVRDITDFVTLQSAMIPKYIRQPDGTLAMASRVDGMMQRSISKVGNAATVQMRGDLFMVVNDWVDKRVTNIGPGVPALYIARAAIAQLSRKLFPSVRTDPLKTVPQRLQGTEYGMDTVEEAVMGVKSEFVRIILPRSRVSVESAGDMSPANSLTPPGSASSP